MMPIRISWIAGGLLAFTLGTGCTRSPRIKEAAYLKRGLALEARHDSARAILEFKNAIKEMPKDPEAGYQLGMAYLIAGQVRNAIGEFQRVVGIDPKYAPAQLKLADLMLSTHYQDLIRQAADELQALLNQAPDSTGVAGRLALAEWSLGRPEEAEKRLQQSLERFPSDLAASVTLARLKLSRHDANGALDVLQKAARNSPKSAAAATALGELYRMTGRTAEAEAELRRGLGLDPTDGLALLSLASIELANQRPQEAEANLRRLSNLSASSYKVLYGDFLWRAGRREEALAEFQRQAKLAPADRQARGRLVEAYLQTGRTGDAQKLLGEALKQNPKDADALLQRSTIELQAGRVDEAGTDLNQVIRFIPNSAEAHFAMSAVDKSRGLAYNERQELSESLRLKPDLMPARLWLVQSLLVANEYRAALDVLNQAPASQQQVLAIAIERNWALLFLGRGQEVQSNLNRELRYGRYPELVLQDAILKMRDGAYADARADAEEVLKQRPEEARAARIVVDSYVAQNQSAKANERLAQLVAAHPQSAALERLSGKWFESTHQYDEARKSFAAAQAADQGSASDSIALAVLDMRQNRLDVARQELLQAIRSDRRNVEALLMLAQVEDRSGQRASAVSYYRDVLNIDANNLVALNNLANRLASENPDEALKLAQQAMEAAPNNPGVEDTLGWIYYRKGMYQSAVEYLKGATDKDPNPRRRLHLGLAYLKSGQRDLGQKLVAMALSADPTLAHSEQLQD